MAKNYKVRDYSLYLDDILESTGKILAYVKGMSFERFSKDDKTIDAVVRNFEILGEASRQLPREFNEKHSQVEWQDIYAFRNIIIHEYFGIDLKIIWDIIKTKLPALRLKIKKILGK